MFLSYLCVVPGKPQTCEKMISANLNICTLESSLVKISSLSSRFLFGLVLWLFLYLVFIQKLHFSLSFSEQNRSM